MSLRKKRKIVESDSDEENISEIEPEMNSSDSESFIDEQKIVLHKIQIENFKSYKNFEEVGPFDEIFTCIVGENGSGKSNLLDAVCFGLGFEAKKLRSKNLSSVVNKESKSNTATVSLILHVINEEKELIKEIKITRKQINNTSNYYHNDEKTTKEKIHRILKEYGIDLFFPERFIILQNNTVKIATKSPTDLVDHLEQLIGTSEVKKNVEKEKLEMKEFIQKKFSLNEELFDIEKERVKNEPEVKKFNYYLEQHERYSNEKEIFYEKLKSLKLLEIEKNEKEIEEFKKDLKETEGILESLEKSINEYEKKIDMKELEIEKMESEKKKLEESIKNSSHEFELTKFNLQKVQKNLKRKQKEMIDIEKMIEKMKLEKKDIEQSLKDLNKNIKNIEEVLKNSTFEESNEIFEEEFEFQKLKQKMNTWNNEGLKLISKMKKNEENINLKEIQLKEAEKEVTKRNEELRTLKYNIDSIQQIKISTEIEIKYFLQKKIEIEKKIYGIESNSNTNNNYWIAKFTSEVQKLQMRNSKIYGILANLGSVDEKYYKSVNTVLSSNLPNTLIVQSHQEALQVVNHFKNNKIGVVSCLILDEIQCNSKDIYHPKLINMSTIIKCDDKFKSCFNKLTGQWYISETLEDAVNISKDDIIKRNIVTLNGEIFKSGGEIQSKRTRPFLITIKSKIENRSNLNVELDSNEKNSKKSLELLKNELRNIETQLTQKRSKIQSANPMDMKSMHEINSIIEKLNLKQEQILTIINLQKEELLSDDIKIQKLELSENEISRLENLQQKKNDFEKTQEKTSSFQENKKIEIFNEMKKNEMKLASISSNLEINDKQHVKLEQEIIEMKGTIKKLKDESKNSNTSQNTKTTSSFTKKLNNLEEELNQLKVELKSFNKSTKDSFKRKLNLECELKSLHEINSELRSELVPLESHKTYFDSHWNSKLHNDQHVIQEELQQIKYNLTQESKQLNDLKDEINIEIIEKDQKLRERIKIINEEFDTIELKIESKNENINCLTTKRYEKFHQNCQKLNDALTYIFQNLNPSSSCYLSYSENKSSAFEEGVVIYCKTDGSWKPFSNLSGGQQAICACALSLSFQFICPCPIFFYDEIDASLDISNTEKVAKLLKTMKNQFICISLRPNMYELSSALIGVYNCENSSRTICKKFD
eukprot:gene3212-5528_t